MILTTCQSKLIPRKPTLVIQIRFSPVNEPRGNASLEAPRFASHKSRDTVFTARVSPTESACAFLKRRRVFPIADADQVNAAPFVAHPQRRSNRWRS